MKITHRDFYLEVSHKQDELCSLSPAEFWPEVKRLINSSPMHGDVNVQFSMTLAGHLRDYNTRKPEQGDTVEDWQPYAKLAAMNYVFNLQTSDKRDSEPFKMDTGPSWQIEEVDRGGWHDTGNNWEDPSERWE